MRILRDRDPNAVHLVTNRTCEARLWITPSANIRKLIGGIFARYQELCGVEIYAYCVLGNHYHVLVRAPNGNLDEFVENVDREIARRLNWKHRKEGKVWARRYTAQRVLSDEDMLEAFLYINTNPSRHGLIQDSSKWPGLNSFEQSIVENDRQFSFCLFTQNKITKHKLKLSPLPALKALGKTKRGEKLQRLLKERTNFISQSKNGNFLGIEAILEQESGDKPMKVSKSPMPSCYTISAKLRREFIMSEILRRQRYDLASCRYRLGLNADFPSHTFKPPLHRLPRFKPFTPIRVEDFQNYA